MYWLGPPFVRASYIFLPPLARARARLRPAAAGSRRLGGRSKDGAAPNLLSTCHQPARAPFAARLDARALRRSCARTPKSGQLVPVQRPQQRPTDGAECARVLCRCGAARRNRRRMWCLGLRLDAHGGGGLRGGGGGGDRSSLCSTPSSSCDGGVECEVFAFPVGAILGASVHAGSMPPASPTPRRTGTVLARGPRRRPHVTHLWYTQELVFTLSMTMYTVLVRYGCIP